MIVMIRVKHAQGDQILTVDHVRIKFWTVLNAKNRAPLIDFNIIESATLATLHVKHAVVGQAKIVYLVQKDRN